MRNAKTGDRAVVAPQDVAETVSRWLAARPAARDADGEPVFLNSQRGRATQSYFLRNVKKFAAQAGVGQRVYTHLLRAAFATHLFNSGSVNPRAIQVLMGHKDIETTLLYNRPTQGDLRTQVENAWSTLLGPKRKVPEPSEAIREYQAGRLTLPQLRSILNVLDQAQPAARSTEEAKGYA